MCRNGVTLTRKEYGELCAYPMKINLTIQMGLYLI